MNPFYTKKRNKCRKSHHKQKTTQCHADSFLLLTPLVCHIIYKYRASCHDKNSGQGSMSKRAPCTPLLDLAPHAESPLRTQRYRHRAAAIRATSPSEQQKEARPVVAAGTASFLFPRSSSLYHPKLTQQASETLQNIPLRHLMPYFGAIFCINGIIYAVSQHIACKKEFKKVLKKEFFRNNLLK